MARNIPFSKFKPDSPAPERLEAWLQEQLGDWAANTRLILTERLRKQKVVLTEDLIRSIEYQVVKASEEKVNSVRLAFEDYGRHKDMRNLFYTQQPPVDVMEQFVRKVGLGKFKYVPGYKSMSSVPSESVAVRRIAWGIARGRLKNYKHKPKKWFAKTFYGQINVLIDTLLEGYQEGAIENIKESFRPKK